MKLMEKVTPRGFKRYGFNDKHGHECSIQMSSFAGVFEEVEPDDNDPRIIIGIDRPEIKVFAPGAGWITMEYPSFKSNDQSDCDDPIPTGCTTFIDGRMELSQTQIKEILPILQKFAETGEI